MENKDVARFADLFAALGSESRLEVMRLLLAAYPKGLRTAEKAYLDSLVRVSASLPIWSSMSRRIKTSVELSKSFETTTTTRF